MSFMEDFRKRPLNYTCVYEERKNRIVAVPRATDPMRHVLATLAFLAVTAVLAAGARLATMAALAAMIPGDNYPLWATLIDSTVAALVLVIMMVSVSPRFGMFPGFFGGKLVLTESAVDKKLATLIKKNPRRLNVDWFRDWSEGTAHKQEMMWQDMKAAIENMDKSSKKRSKPAKESQAPTTE